MGSVFTFVFAVIFGCVGFILLTLGLVLRKKMNVASIISYVCSGICFIPLLCFAVAMLSNIVQGKKSKNEYAKENGRIFAELVYGSKNSIIEEAEKTENLNVFDKNGRTPLSIACWKCCLSVLETMVENGADPNLKNSDGSTALHAAVSGFHADSSMVEYLIKSGADVNCQDGNGNTPLLTFLQNGSHSEIILDLLLSNGADVALKNKAGDDAIMVAEALMKREREEVALFPVDEFHHGEVHSFYDKVYDKLLKVWRQKMR